MPAFDIEELLVKALPIGACVLSGKNHIIEVVNEQMLAIWSKDPSVIGKPLHEAIPELRGQPFFDLIINVYATGKAHHSPGTLACIMVNGIVQERYFNLSFKPLYSASGEICGVLNTAINITEKMNSSLAVRRLNEELLAAEEQLRSAIESSNLGTYAINAETGSMTSSLRLKEIFGYGPDENVLFDSVITQTADEFREQVISAVNDVIENDVNFDLEYAVITHSDQQLRWIRSTGKRYKGINGRPNYFTGTVQDITERKADDQRKNDFIAMVSHELKTPLTSVIANIQFLLGEAHKGNRLMAETLERAHRQLRKMNTMINGFLSVSRLESGKIYIERIRFDMKELVKEVENEIVASTLSHTVIFHPVLTTCVNGDRDKIGHVITNFITNSIKYSLPGTIIQVACQAVGGYAQVSVQDQGMGIAKKDIDRLFERYYRVEGQETIAIAGFGIGLYLSYEIIKRHEGEIWVTSEVGKGSTFYFKLPIAD